MALGARPFIRRSVGLTTMVLGGFAFVFAFLFATYMPSLTWTFGIMVLGAAIFLFGLIRFLNPYRGRKRRLLR